MTTCYMREDGYRFQLLMTPDEYVPQHLFTFFVQVIAQFWPILRPLSADLWVESRVYDPEIETYLKSENKPTTQAWHIRDESIPESIALKGRIGDAPQEDIVPSLTPDAIGAWLRRATGQTSSPDSVIVPDYMSIHFTRSRLYDVDVEVRDTEITLPVQAWRGGPIAGTAPIERRGDGLWVAAPTPDVMYPPVTLAIGDYWDTSLQLTVHVYWSPWFEEGTAEYWALRHVLAQLVRLGWIDNLDNLGDVVAGLAMPSPNVVTEKGIA